jgi:hypothetical protein
VYTTEWSSSVWRVVAHLDAERFSYVMVQSPWPTPAWQTKPLVQTGRWGECERVPVPDWEEPDPNVA